MISGRLLATATIVVLALACQATSDPTREQTSGEADSAATSTPGGGSAGGGSGAGVTCSAASGCTSVAGRVYDSFTGLPVEGVRIEVRNYDLPPDDTLFAVAFTGGDGTFESPPTVPVQRRWRLFLTRDGYLPRSFGGNSILGPIPIDPVDAPTAGIQGTVRVPSLAAVTGALIEVWPGPNITDDPPVASTTSDSASRYAFYGLPAGMYTVRITARWFVPAVGTVTAPATFSPILALDFGGAPAEFEMTWSDPTLDLDLVIVNWKTGERHDGATRGTCGFDNVCHLGDARAGGASERVQIGQGAADVPGGWYELYVNNYTAYAEGRASTDQSLALSGARLTLRIGGEVVATATVPALGGRTWFVARSNPPFFHDLRLFGASPSVVMPATFDWSIDKQ